MPPQFPTDAQMAQAWKDADKAWAIDDAKPAISDTFMKLALGRSGNGLSAWIEQNRMTPSGERPFADLVKTLEKVSGGNSQSLNEAIRALSASVKVSDQYLNSAGKVSTPLGSYANLLRGRLGPSWGDTKSRDTPDEERVTVSTNAVDFSFPDEELKSVAAELDGQEFSEADVQALDQELVGDSSLSAGVHASAPEVARRLNVSLPQARAVLCGLIYTLMIALATLMATQDSDAEIGGGVVVAGLASPVVGHVRSRWPENEVPPEEEPEDE